jgi:hypothetical protein
MRPPNPDVVRARAKELVAALPPNLVADARGAAMRLRNARSPRQAVAAVDAELERLFAGLAPALIEHPLPVPTTRRALATVAIVAGSAAAVDELEAIALLLPGVDAVAAPSLPLVAAASFTALALEAYVAGSLRVHRLRAAGARLDAARLTRDVLTAMTGRDDATLTHAATNSLTKRMMRRWGRGMVPFVGIGYASWDAQRTVRAIARMPVYV